MSAASKGGMAVRITVDTASIAMDSNAHRGQSLATRLVVSFAAAVAIEMARYYIKPAVRKWRKQLQDEKNKARLRSGAKSAMRIAAGDARELARATELATRQLRSRIKTRFSADRKSAQVIVDDPRAALIELGGMNAVRTREKGRTVVRTVNTSASPFMNPALRSAARRSRSKGQTTVKV